MKKAVFSLMACLGVFVSVFGQKDDLMIIEYVDTEGPTYAEGYGIRIWNPTASTIDLSNYYVQLYYNGATNSLYTENLTGSLPPDSTFVIGNDEYCQLCGNCDFEMATASGVNENDVIALTSSTGNTFVDMIGAHDVNVSPTVDDTMDALLHHRLIRNCGNDTRYFNSASVSGPSNNSWYNSTALSMPGWRVEPIGCLEHQIAPEPEFELNDTSVCTGTDVLYDFSGVDADSITWYAAYDTSTGTGFIATDSGKVVVEVYSGCSGISRDSADISYISGPDVLDLDLRDIEICDGDSEQVFVNSYDYDSLRWSWSGNTYVGDTLVVEEEGEYVVELLATCGAIDTFEVALNPLPDPGNINLPDDTICSFGDSALYQLPVNLLDSIIWLTPEDKVYGSLLVASKAGTYYVQVYTSCESVINMVSDTFEIAEKSCDPGDPDIDIDQFVIPNIITPNGDGINDAFVISGLVIEVDLKVYNRWGKPVFEQADYQNDWSPDHLPDGTYYFVISYRGLSPDSDPQSLETRVGHLQIQK